MIHFCIVIYFLHADTLLSFDPKLTSIQLPCLRLNSVGAVETRNEHLNKDSAHICATLSESCAVHESLYLDVASGIFLQEGVRADQTRYLDNKSIQLAEESKLGYTGGVTHNELHSYCETLPSAIFNEEEVVSTVTDYYADVAHDQSNTSDVIIIVDGQFFTNVSPGPLPCSLSAVGSTPPSFSTSTPSVPLRVYDLVTLQCLTSVVQDVTVSGVPRPPGATSCTLHGSEQSPVEQMAAASEVVSLVCAVDDLGGNQQSIVDMSSEVGCAPISPMFEQTGNTF